MEPGGPPATGVLRSTALIALSLTFGLVQFDATVVNVALPTLRRDLGGSIGAAQWVVDGYAVPFAACMLAAGAWGDRIGHRRSCLIGFGLFGLSSLLSGLAAGWQLLIIGRVLQGVAAAIMLPPSLAMIGRLYPERRSRSRALGIWGGVATSGFAAGPIVGGLLITHAGWPAIFLINIPIVILVGAAIAITAPPDRPRPRRLDPVGTLLGTGSLAALAGAIIESGQGRPAVGLGLLVLAVITATGFVAVERRSAGPTMPPGLFRPAGFRWAIVTGFGFNFAMYGALLCVSLVLQSDFGFSALDGGLAVLPMALVVSIGATGSGFLAARLGPRRPMLAGFGLAAAGSVVIALGTWQRSPVLIITGLTVIGLCSLAMPAMTSVALNAAPADHAGLAGGALNTARQLGGAIGVAVLGALLNAGGPRDGATVALLVGTMVCGLAVVSAVRATTDDESAGRAR
ncbi:MFS transporter, DHA2 family, methylenomycin A resistance protein [Microlunatus soli]|uniref:MFS transporter, DHA2 family, methylenomycin A resistance protein n=2 Tax=Microlunatus soli TaxID=630515 RepID=A0A1H1YJZ6_9ACTN|nr:MFS transporter, DHA2 family, methylenomycin A resistance protein [Microlunatus soli]